MRRKECDKPIRIRRWLAAMAAAAWMVPWAAADSIRVWPGAVVTGDHVTLGHVCDLSEVPMNESGAVAATIVMPAPVRGGSANVTLDQIQAALRRAGVNLAEVVISGATRCTVTRPEEVDRPPTKRDPSLALRASTGAASRIVTDEASLAEESPADGRTLRDAVRRLFESYARQHGGRIELQFARTSPDILNLSEPQYSFQVRLNGGRWLGRMVKVDVDVLAGDRKVQTVPLVVNAAVTRKIVAARRPINLEATVTEDDVELAERVFDSMDGAVATELDAVIGQRAKHFIPAGHGMGMKDLEQVPLVTRGQAVDVISLVGRIEARKAGKAIDGGGLGDVVEVRVGGSRGDVLTGMVTGKRRVMVGAPRADAGETQVHLAWGGGQ